MSEENNQAGGAAVAEHADDGGLREVPADITEYRKFVAEGGNEHNDRIRARQAAEKAARDAGLTVAEDDGAHSKTDPFKKRMTRFTRELDDKLSERDKRIEDLETRLQRAQANGHQKPDPAAADTDATERPAAAREAPERPAAEQEPDGPAAAEDDDKPPERPKEADFKAYSDFTVALARWAVKIDEYERNQAQKKKAIEEYENKIKTAHAARVNEAKARYDDWDAVFEDLDNRSLSQLMYLYIPESDNGAEILYYLATHREELARIRQLNPMRQAYELGRIEDQLSAGDKGADGEGDKPAKPAAKPAAKKEDADAQEKPAGRYVPQSRAAAPAKPLGGRGGSDDAMPDLTDFVAYEKWAKRQQAKANQ
jgi:hypothetical protein